MEKPIVTEKKREEAQCTTPLLAGSSMLNTAFRFCNGNVPYLIGCPSGFHSFWLQLSCAALPPYPCPLIITAGGLP